MKNIDTQNDFLFAYVGLYKNERFPCDLYKYSTLEKAVRSAVSESVIEKAFIILIYNTSPEICLYKSNTLD